MLYGLDDDENEFGLVEKEKISAKKIAVIISIIIVILLIIIFFIVKVNNKNEIQEIAQNQEMLNEESQDDVDDTIFSEEAKYNLSNVKNEKYSQENISKVHSILPEHSIEKIKSKFVPQPNENAQNLIKDIYYSDEKQVYLTFDDGPSKNITPQILNILKENDVKATFFVLGARVELYPELLKQEFEEGHYIANHGYSHQYSKIYESKDTTFGEFIDCENAIKNALGNPDYNSYLFRFPGGSSGGRYASVKAEARELLNSYGIAQTNWNCLTGDAENKTTKEACIQEMIDTKGNQNSIILLMHDAADKSQTAEALPEIIQYFKNEGYTFKTFYEIFK